MKKVYIVQAQGWGDDENAMYNISGHSTRKLAEAAVKELVKQAHTDGLTDVVTAVEVISIDA